MTATSHLAQQSALIASFTEAWEAGDIDALMELMSDRCTFRASTGPEPGATFAGREEVRRGFEMFLTAARLAPPAVDTVTEELLIAADFAVTRWTTRHRQPDGTMLLARACDVFGFENGRISSKDTYRKVSGQLPQVS